MKNVIESPVREEYVRSDLYKSLNRLGEHLISDGLTIYVSTVKAIKSTVRELPILEKKYEHSHLKYIKEDIRENIDDLKRFYELLIYEFDWVRRSDYKIEETIVGGYRIERKLSKELYEQLFCELQVRLDDYSAYWEDRFNTL